MSKLVIVCYHAETNEIRLWTDYTPYKHYLGSPWLVWTSLTFAIRNGWEVIGEL